MSTYRLDPITKEMATDHANREAEIYGFKYGSPKWIKAYKEFANEAVHTMAVGRNPSSKNSHSYKIRTTYYPDIFSQDGFAGRVAKNFTTETKEDRKSTRLNSSHIPLSRMPSSA